MNLRVGSPAGSLRCYVIHNVRVSVLSPAIDQGDPYVEIVIDKDGHEHARARLSQQEALALAALLQKSAT